MSSSSSSKDVQIVYRDSKRNRRPTSCEQCRIRKAKCNRELPCENCIKRGDRVTCKYANNAIRNRKCRSNNVGERLKRVESLVSELIGGSEGKHERAVDRSRDGIVDGSTYVYEERKARGQIANSHWLSILDDIKEVREQLAQSDALSAFEDDDLDILEETQEEEEIDLVLGAMQPLPTLRDIISSLPPRPVCDMFLSRYFTSPIILPIIHTIKFQNEYEKFWQDSTKAPPLWIGLLYSILACVASVQQAMNNGAVAVEETSNQPLSISVKALRSKTVQCLILGKYTNGQPYALETLVMHLLGINIAKPDASFDGWFLMGTIIRLAMRMGYHRDPDNNKTSKAGSKITPFEGEMRRRRWHAILQLDTLISFQMGMPSVIPPEFCDTEPPRNLKDEDIWASMETLPPSRPFSDYTPVLYTIAKGEVMNMFRKILVHAHHPSSSSSTSSTSYSATVDLDAKLRATYASIPEMFAWKPINQSFTVPSGLIICRSTIELLYLKSIIVLHRRYLNTERHDPQCDSSRRACINAALQVLARQTELHDATSSPHGRLYEERWMVSSLTAHDFLLASMVICLELSMLMRSPSPQPLLGRAHSSNQQTASLHFSSLLDALLNSQRIWASKSAYSNEARTAAMTLQLMIDKVQETNKFSSSFSPESADLSTAETEAEAEAEAETETRLPFADTITDMITGSEDLDWTLLDHYLQNTGSNMPPLFDTSGQAKFPYDEWGLWDVDVNMNMGIDADMGMNFPGMDRREQGYGSEYFQQ